MTVKVFSNSNDSKPTLAPIAKKLLVQIKPEHAVILSKLSLSGLSVSNILIFLQLILGALAAVPVIGQDAVLASVLIGLYQKAAAAYQLATGQPFDVTKIPLEDRV